MISPSEVEQHLLKFPLVKDCAVLGIADDILGQELQALIVADEIISPKVLQEFLKDRIPAYMVPRYFGYVDAIPKTETEKIKRYELEEMTVEIIDTHHAYHGVENK